MAEQSKRIGLFGGTFDPVHKGHLSIAKSFLKSDKIDKLWVLINPTPPHKENEEFAPFNARFEMLKTAFEPFENAIVSGLEVDLPAPTYTLQTISYLTKKYPDYSFKLCMGKDSFLTFNTWFRWQEILKYCSLLVAERPTEDKDVINEPLIKKHAVFIDHSPINISSTEIRQKVARGESIDNLVPQCVADIIKEQQLYLK